jgi:hypothetical protein
VVLGLGVGEDEDTRGSADEGEEADWSAVAVGLGVAVAERCGERAGVFVSVAPVEESVCLFEGWLASCPPEGVGTGQKTSNPYRQKRIATT